MTASSLPPVEQIGIVSIDDFAKAVHRLLNAAWGPDWGVFTEEDTALNDPNNVPLPQIIWHLEERVSQDKMNPRGKSRSWGAHVDKEYPGHTIEVRKWWFDCKVSFQCVAHTHKEARHLARRLEYFLVNYTGYFKEHGISEISFLRELGPRRFDHRQTNLPFRVLLFDVRIEQNDIVRTKAMEEIVIKASLPQPE